eukprot:768144-Hanusia_phi.AAC.2
MGMGRFLDSLVLSSSVRVSVTLQLIHIVFAAEEVGLGRKSYGINTIPSAVRLVLLLKETYVPTLSDHLSALRSTRA